MSSPSPLAIPDTIEEANRVFLRRRQQLAAPIVAGEPGLQVAETLRQVTDEWLIELWTRALPDRFHRRVTLYATGGYGRDELAFHSDIDVLVAVADDDIAGDAAFALAVERLMAWSRHTRLSVSHAVRTPAQTRQMLTQDPKTAIALLDIRHLHGPRKLHEVFQRRFVIDHLRGDEQGREFVTDLIDRMRRRIARNGETIYLLEPDVKNGEGGLRDLNSLGWASRVRWRLDARDADRTDIGWSEDVRDDYRRHLDELLALRNRLHLLCGRKQDRLNFRDQEALVLLDEFEPPTTADRALEQANQAVNRAESPAGDGAEHSESHRRIENLMSRHYRRARRIATRCQRLLRRWATAGGDAPRRDGPYLLYDDRIDLADDAELTDEMVFEVLDTAGRHNLLLDPRLETRLEHRIAHWRAGDDVPAPLAHRLCELLTDTDQPPRTCRRLVDLGVLTAVVPEFEPLLCHVQHDLYHVYTTDVHSRRCLDEGRSLLVETPDRHDWPAFCRIGAEIEDHTTFLLACLFHDIGKNRGGNHSEKGARMVRDIGPRLGLDDDQTDRLEFLVRHHLDLSTTSRRRDISDPEIIDELAGTIGELECLNQLTALTYCDMATVGPDVMNDWTASLLTELYGRLHAALTPRVPAVAAGEAVHQNDSRQVIRDQLADVVDGLDDVDDTGIDRFVDTLPVDHLRYTEGEAMTRQYHTWCRGLDAADDVAVVSTPLEHRSVTEVVVSGPDRPGTLARIAGAIASVGLNIMTADIVTTDDGRTLDIFFVAHFNPRAVPPAKPRPVDEPRRLDRLETRITDVLCDRIDVDALLQRRRSERRLPPRHVPSVRSSVDVDTEASSRFTVIEVRTPDRLGLLHDIATTLHHCRVDTRLSRIDSLGHQAIDTFYLQQFQGGPLDDDQTRRVVDALNELLAPPGG